jgi:hypothetical protein
MTYGAGLGFSSLVDLEWHCIGGIHRPLVGLDQCQLPATQYAFFVQLHDAAVAKAPRGLFGQRADAFDTSAFSTLPPC